MRRQTSENLKKHLFSLNDLHTVDTSIPARQDVEKVKRNGEAFYARATRSTPYHARLYCTAGFIVTPSSLAARRTKCGSRKNSRASRTRSALSSATRSFACCGAVIISMVPTMMSGCAFLIAFVNGNYEKGCCKTGSTCAGAKQAGGIW